jgi:battenin
MQIPLPRSRHLSPNRLLAIRYNPSPLYPPYPNHKLTSPGLINNVSYVIILSAALDLVGPSVPKGIVLLADILPAFIIKLIAPYFIHRMPHPLRIVIMCALSAGGMFLIALTPSVTEDNGSISLKLFGVAMAALSAGGGELSLLGLTHYYGPFSLAAWGSGTGGAGLVGSGLYVLLTSTIGLSVKNSLLTSAFLPFIMPLAFFFILPLGPLRRAKERGGYEAIPSARIDDDDIRDLPVESAADALLAPGASVAGKLFCVPCSFSIFSLPFYTNIQAPILPFPIRFNIQR